MARPSSTDRRHSLTQADGLEYSKESFLEDIERDPDATWERIKEVVVPFFDRVSELENEISHHETQIVNKEAQIAALIAERDEYKDELFILWRQKGKAPLPESDAAPQDTRRGIIEHIVPTTEAGTTAVLEKGIKIPDPPIFEGKTDIDPWLVKMRGKLSANAWLFPTEDLRIQYTLSRVSERAYKHLEPRLLPNAEIRFHTAEEIFDYLARIYVDPGRKRKARDEFRRIRQAQMPFNDFWAEFQRLALEVGKSEEDQLEELQDKLSDELKTALAIHSPDDLYKYVSLCQTTEQKLRGTLAFKKSTGLIDPRTKGNPSWKFTSAAHATNQTTDNRNTNTLKPAATSSRASTPAARQRPSYADPERQKLSDSGACFYCKEQGHMARNCPRKPRSFDVVTGVVGESERGKD